MRSGHVPRSNSLRLSPCTYPDESRLLDGRGFLNGSVANRDCGGLTACVLDGSYAAMPKIA